MYRKTAVEYSNQIEQLDELLTSNLQAEGFDLLSLSYILLIKMQILTKICNTNSFYIKLFKNLNGKIL